MIRLLLRFCLLWKVSAAIFHLPLGRDSVIHWDLDYEQQELIVEVHTRNIDPAKSGWMGIGFSNYGNLSDESGDFCIVWKSLLQSSSQLQLTDVHIIKDTVVPDHHQDCLGFKYLLTNSTLKWTFRRKFVTCDAKDYAIEEGTTHLHWIKGNGPLYDIKGVSTKKASDSGFLRVRLLKNMNPDPVLDPKETSTIDVITSKVKVPAHETTYWCAIIRLPENVRAKKHHIIQFAVNVQKGNEELVHHMEVFRCAAPPNTELPLYAGPCDQAPQELSPCSQVMAAWAMGAEPLRYPIQAGYPIGGPDFNPYVRLEIHYNNPAKKGDWVDSSGMTFWVTEKFRAYDAGVIELGLEYTDKNSIPPGQEGFVLTGVCNTECTSVGLPLDGVMVFASQLHTHLSGIRVITRHFRRKDKIFYRQRSLLQQNRTSALDLEGYIELPTFNWDNHYSTHFQEIRLLKNPIKLLPGDVLLTSCEYRTLDRTQMTVGGYAISDEMCVNYIHYYPKAGLEVCKSSVSWESLREYFQFQSEMDGQTKVVSSGPVSDNYNAIQWTPFRAKLLEDFYNRSPIDMQCNQSDGSRFPGEWNHMTVPDFPPLEPKFNPNLEPECPLIHLSRDVVEIQPARTNEGGEGTLEDFLSTHKRSGVFPA